MARVETGITVRYWAAARAAAGVAEEEFAAPCTLDALRSSILELHSGSDRLGAVLAACSVLVDGRQPIPPSGRAPGDAVLAPGSTVEFLPPFAGG